MMDAKTNGVNGVHHDKEARFELPMRSQEDVEVDLEVLFEVEGKSGQEREDTLKAAYNEVLFLFETEEAAAQYWARAVYFLWSRGHKKYAFDLGEAGLKSLKDTGKQDTSILLLCLLATLKLKMARHAAKLVMEHATLDILKGDEMILREVYQKQAQEYINQAKTISPKHPVVIEAEVTLILSRGDVNAAETAIKALLDFEPSNLVARLVEARLQLHKRQFALALSSFQKVLRSAPRSLPDPRIGIGLCYWHLGDRNTAEKAWRRSMKVNPGVDSLGAQLLLSISCLNASKKEDVASESGKSADDLYIEGIKMVTDVFKLSEKTHPMAAAVLSGHFGLQSNYDVATKLAERSIQFSDNRMISAEGHYKLARLWHARGDLTRASAEYIFAVRDRPDLLPARIAQAHLLMARGSIPEAENTFISVLEKQPQCIEAQAGLAAIHANASFTAISANDQQTSTKKAMEDYEQILRTLSLHANSQAAQTSSSVAGDSLAMRRRIQTVAQDAQLYIEIGRLWEATDQTRALKAFKTAAEVQTDAGKTVQPQVLNNIGCLEFAKRNYSAAQPHFESALSSVNQLEDPTEFDAAVTTCSYNLAQVYEVNGEIEKARDVYEKRLLPRHPEWTDAKARLALIHIKAKEFDHADEVLKEALTSAHKSPELRALYLHYLLETRQEKWARDFATATIRDFASNDVYANCALAMILYSQAREMRPSNAEQARDKANKNVQSAEFYSRALRYDANCAFAAQGLAIALAEGSLISSSVTDQAIKLKASRDALSILAKVRDTINDASVYVNIGHLHSAREEWDKAIESYTTATNRFYKGSNVACLLYLARAWFHKANKDLSYIAITRSLFYVREAATKHPQDDAIKFNIAIIQHKGLEILTNLSPERRTLKEIKEAIELATEANATFSLLAANKAKHVAYPVEMAEQRTRYGANLVSRAANEAVPAQENHESTEQAKIAQAKAARDAEKSAQAQAQAARTEEIRLRNEMLAASRREMQEQAASWYQKDAYDSDENKKGKKGRGRKAAKENEFVVNDGEGEEDKPKRPAKRKGAAKNKKAKSAASTAAGEEDAEGQNREGSEEEDDEAAMPPSKRIKQFKSTEFVDSDEEE